MTIPLYRRLGKTLGNKDWGQNSDIIQSYVFFDLDATASSDANQLNVYYKRFPVSTQTSATGAGERFVSEIKYRNIRYCLAFSSHITSTAVFFYRNSELLLSYVKCGFCSHSYWLHVLSRRGFGSMKCMIASTQSKQLVVADRDVIILRLYMELKVVKPERNWKYYHTIENLEPFLVISVRRY